MKTYLGTLCCTSVHRAIRPTTGASPPPRLGDSVLQNCGIAESQNYRAAECRTMAIAIQGKGKVQSPTRCKPSGHLGAIPDKSIKALYLDMKGRSSERHFRSASSEGHSADQAPAEPLPYLCRPSLCQTTAVPLLYPCRPSICCASAVPLLTKSPRPLTSCVSLSCHQPLPFPRPCNQL